MFITEKLFLKKLTLGSTISDKIRKPLYCRMYVIREGRRTRKNREEKENLGSTDSKEICVLDIGKLRSSQK